MLRERNFKDRGELCIGTAQFMRSAPKACLKALLIAFALVALSFTGVHADSADQIKQKIAENSKKIEDLQKQIDQYSSLLNLTSRQATDLKSALRQLELTQKKLETNLALTSTQIKKTSLTLEDLESDIETTEKGIASTTDAISESIRAMQTTESQSVIENLLETKSLSDTWDYVNALHTLESRLKINLDDLRDERMFLGAKRDQAVGEKTKLESYRKTLADQSKVVELNKAEKDKLLKDTQSKEAAYKAILAEKTKQKEEFEKELFSYESQLKITVDPNAIPNARSGILSWPLDSISVTQYFGKTVSAKRLYTSGTHGGIDLRASVGTEVKAALSGTVMDTEAVKYKSGCQYGKFVLIRHPNGLATIYGHLSVVSVKPGDTIVTGDRIGYSGDTGYATGPHLHFGVYLASAVKIVDASALGSGTCKGIKTVAAPTTAYLDPMSYLPTL